ncbi:MAG: beta-propeller domain-containing protein [Candidatus Moranbacteria bacterium]|nr:beta-propeller domain-containing protein [Candidatus Moranbacteria bacterium]
METQNNLENETAPVEIKKDHRIRIILPALAVLFFVLLIAQNYFYAKNGGWLKKPNFANNSSGQDITLTQKLQNESKIKKFSNYQELQDFVENNSPSNNFGRMTLDSAVGNAAMPMAEKGAGSAAGMGGADYSQTNVQVAGVDEADLVKTDGEYIYSVADKTLFITRANPVDNASVEAKIEFKSTPQSIYLKGNRLVIFGGDQEIFGLDSYHQFKRKSPYSFFKVFDITDKKNPKQIRDLDFEGSYLNSRMIGNYVYFLTSTYTQYYEGEMPVPRILNGGKEIYASTDLAKCPNCPPVYYFDMPYESMNMVNVAAINIDDETENLTNQVYLLSGEQNFYASQNNLYITYTKHLSEYDLFMGVAKDLLFSRLSEKDQARISKIEAVDNSILSEQEKMSKISVVIEHYIDSLSDDEGKKAEKELSDEMQKKYTDISKELEKTVIHKIAINGNKLEYQNFGEVTGAVLNQFSMDEDAVGNFRIATTKNQDFSPLYFFNNFGISGTEKIVANGGQGIDTTQNQSYSNLYVLDNNLKVIGAVEDLAKGERIYSARFMQNRAYLVTYKQTDPLFVIDLRDARNPKVLGELKVPGFSSYLHPYDDTTLIGLGKETTESTSGAVSTGGLKLSLFDVSDVANPKEIDKYDLGSAGSDSLALNEHKAFLFSREKNLLVIPVTLTDSVIRTSAPWQEIFNGVAVFNIDKNGFKLKGKISQDIKNNSTSGYYDYYSNGLKRALYIGDNLYTVSNQYLQINKLDNLDLVKRISLKGEEDFRVVVPTQTPTPMPMPTAGTASNTSIFGGSPAE